MMQPLSRTVLQVTARSLISTTRPFICKACLQSLTPSPNRPSQSIRASHPSPQSHRTFTSAPTRNKKSASNPKSARKTPKVESPDVSTHIPDNKATRNKDSEIDPYDFTNLQVGIDTAITRLKAALTKTRDAGRVSTSDLESLPVEINTKTSHQPSHTHSGQPPTTKQTSRLGDIASVAPKGGRTLQVFAASEEHVKPLISAIQASPYSLTPAPPDPESGNALCITVPIPPVTAETRATAAAETKKCLEKTTQEIRTARGEMQKKYRRMEIERLVIADEIHKAKIKMEEVVKKGNEEAKKLVDGAVKALER